MKVLLVVDVQKDFCPGGALAVSNGDQTVPIINSLIGSQQFDLVVASLDWHPADHVSFAATHKLPVFSSIETEHGRQMLWPVHCVEDSPGAEFHADLNVNGIDLVVKKGTDPTVDSYSAFFDNAKAQSTGLHEQLLALLKQRGETIEDVEIYVCGLATDYCVKASAIDAAQLGMSTTLVIDAARAVDATPGDEFRALQAMAAVGVECIESAVLLQQREIPIIDHITGTERESGRVQGLNA